MTIIAALFQSFGGWKLEWKFMAQILKVDKYLPKTNLLITLDGILSVIIPELKVAWLTFFDVMVQVTVLLG